MVKSVKCFTNLLGWFDKFHQHLPQGVHSFPTLKGKKRFQALVTFNYFIFVYVLLHKLIIPACLWVMRPGNGFEGLEFGIWYLYHAQFIYLFRNQNRKEFSFFAMISIAWFGIGYLPLSIGLEVWGVMNHGISWNTISSLLCYVSSFVWTCFLLYRLRMPTTTYLYQIPGRLKPRFQLAFPFWSVGFLTSIIWYVILYLK